MALAFTFWLLTILVCIEVGHRLGVKAGMQAERERNRRHNHPSSDWFRP